MGKVYYQDMYRIAGCSMLPLCLTLLMAADPPWKVKPIQEWSPEEARQVLTDSPWAKMARTSAAPQRGGGPARKDAGRGSGIVVRWESALPVRGAELKAGELAAPDWQGDFYAIAVYNVPGLSGSLKFLAGELKRAASLKLDGKRDIKPARVDVEGTGNRLARVVYLFPRSVPITAEDKRIEFVAQLGDLSLAPYFMTEEMQFQGKLEL